MRTFRCIPLLLALPVLSALLVGCGRDAASDDAETPSASEGNEAPRTVAELQQRTLDYVLSLRQPSDVSGHAISRALRVRLEAQYPDADSQIARNQRLQDGYGFYVTHARRRDGVTLPMQEVMLFPPEGKTLSAGNNGVCPWRESDVARALEQGGYRRGGEVPFNEGMLRSYTRDIGKRAVQLEVGLLTYATTVGGVPTVCLHGLRLAEITLPAAPPA